MPNTPPITRRRLIGSAARLAALGAASMILPPNISKLLAQTPLRMGSLRDIKHVVILMQENRSFDHYFGTLSGVRGFNDPAALTLANGRNVFHQPDPENSAGYLLPFHLDTSATNAQKLPSTSHAWAVQHEAWNNGRMDQWLPAHRKADGANGPYIMGYFRREDIPFHYALADAFTICDAYHCSVMGPTWPNRLYHVSATIDPEGMAGGPIIRNKIPPDGLRWKTYAERLEEARISWRCYQHLNAGAGFNLLRYFHQFQDSSANSPLRLKGMPTDQNDQFAYDVRHDQLPAVSWLIPSVDACEHPDYLPAAGADFIASRLNALAANLDVWAKTVFILNYDENDGLFDHVPPPVPPKGTPHEFIGGLPIGGGFRVPCIIASPWTVGGWVCSEPFDHTSILRFLERLTGVREPNINDWRRRTFGDLTSAFRFANAAAKAPSLPDTRAPLHQAQYAAAHYPPPSAPTDQALPGQEKGQRPKLHLP